MLKYILLEGPLHFCSTLEVFGEGVVCRILIVFLSLGGFCFQFRLCGLFGCWLLCLVNSRSSVAGRFLGMKLHMGFWDAPKPGGT